jgi:hypothetical protein
MDELYRKENFGRTDKERHGLRRWKRVRPPGKCNLNSVLKRKTAVSFSRRKPSHLLTPDRQNGVASPMRKTSWVRDGWAIKPIMAFTR